MRYTTLVAALVAASVFAAPGFGQVSSPPGGIAAQENRIEAAVAAQGMFARDRNVSVLQRPRPELDQLGVRVGAFFVYPQIDLGLTSNDNVFAEPTGERDDIIYSAAPSFVALTNWSRHALTVGSNLSVREYADFDDESVVDWTAFADGRIDIVRDTFATVGAGYGALTEPRTAPTGFLATVEPVEFDQTTGYVGFERTVNRVRGQVKYDILDLAYDPAVLVPSLGGGVISNEFRDRFEQSLTVRGDYAISPATAVFGRLRLNNRDYDLEAPAIAAGSDRDSDGFTIDAGVDFDLTAVARGNIALGYTEQDYEGSDFNKVDGLAVSALVEWFPSSLTTVTAQAGRMINESSIPGSSGIESANIQISIDHELRRNVILNARGGFANDVYDGIDREDNRWTAAAGATYQVNRSVGVRGSISFTDQDSTGFDAQQDYSQTVVGLSLVLRR